MSKLTSFLGAFGRFAQVKTLCRVNGRGIYKRIDENRELLELLQRESPDLMKRCPWIEGWLESQDHFLVELAATVGTKNNLAGSFPNYPRPWPGHDRKGA